MLGLAPSLKHIGQHFSDYFLTDIIAYSIHYSLQKSSRKNVVLWPSYGQNNPGSLDTTEIDWSSKIFPNWDIKPKPHLKRGLPVPITCFYTMTVIQ